MRLLLAIDDSPHSESAIRSLRDDMSPDGHEVLVLHAVQPVTSSPDDESTQRVFGERVTEPDEAFAGGAELVRKTAARLAKWGFRVELAVEEGDARSAILRRAKSWHPDLIVMGSHSRKPLERVLLDSISDSVMRDANCSLLIIKNL
jgi:nucleotide-binding universal stress UspA family protein